MSTIKRWIPFGWLPGHWGLSGSIRERSKIEYENDGYHREILLLDLERPSKEIEKEKIKVKRRYDVITDYEYQQAIIDIETFGDLSKNQLAKLNLDYTQGRIPKNDYELKKTELEFGSESDEYKLLVLKFKYEANHIDRNQYEKQVANICDQPWVKVVSSTYDPGEGIDGFSFVLDFNEGFVQYLRTNGYIGVDDSEVVEQWFDDVSKTEFQAEIEADLSIPKTNIGIETVQTPDGNKVKKFF